MLDILLTAILVVALPAYMLWRSIRSRGRQPEPRMSKYVRSMAIAAPLTVIVIAEWSYRGRSFAGLGLGAPVSATALLGLCLAACILVIMAVGMTNRLRNSKSNGEDDPSREIMPETREEYVVFVLFSLVVGCSWEVLYRGYLLWMLTPHVGLIAAVVVAAGAYGIGHGFRTAKMFAASMISALIFTTAFALTQSLWWLMLVHCGLPLIGAAALGLTRLAGASPAEEVEALARARPPTSV